MQPRTVQATNSIEGKSIVEVLVSNNNRSWVHYDTIWMDGLDDTEMIVIVPDYRHIKTEIIKGEAEIAYGLFTDEK